VASGGLEIATAGEPELVMALAPIASAVTGGFSAMSCPDDRAGRRRFRGNAGVARGLHSSDSAASFRG